MQDDQNMLVANGPVQPGPRSNKLKRIIAAAMLVVMLVALGLVTYLWRSQASELAGKDKETAELISAKEDRIARLEAELEIRKETTGEESIKTDQYQSVFFTGGQVYFGKIAKITESQITLTDIYYLTDGGDALRKLGNEVHGPEDVMYIERNKVDYWENLKPDGEVAKAIAEYTASLR